ncbi:MAG: hypothetical protein K6C34_02435 [Alphaproteobacteria bacterium]|nr:hypothetical protein [Alphaproteobacteria bacterium]
MKIYLDNFTDFVPGPSAKELWDEIDSKGKMDGFEALLDECYPEGLSDGRLNDLLRFEEDWIREMLDMPEDEEESFDCPCDCTECDYADKCSENGRYDFYGEDTFEGGGDEKDAEDDDDLLTDLQAEQNEQQKKEKKRRKRNVDRYRYPVRASLLRNPVRTGLSGPRQVHYEYAQDRG